MLPTNLPLSWLVLITYVAVISVISVIICLYDKSISKFRRANLRTAEKTLFILSALGGSVAMLITMLLTRHKTKHLSFMLGIPLIIFLQAIAIAVLIALGVLPL